MPRVGATVGTSAMWPSSPISDSEIPSPAIAVMIGSSIAVAVPKANSRMTTAAPIPISSLLPSSALDTALPR